jgi:3-hydroxyisobutyrate dehydrogenase
MPTTAFLGLGAMGAPMARRLLAAGYPLTVWNRTRARAEALAAADGARVAADPADAARDADTVVTMLTGPAAVAAVADAMAPGLRPGTRVVEMSTIGPAAVTDLAARLPEGVALVDAPVMGSVDRAAAGTLTVLAGGDAEPVAGLLGVLGTVTRCGPVGSGAALKVVLITSLIGGVALTGAALALGDAFGLPEGVVRDALAAGPLAGAAQRAAANGAHYPLALAAKDVGLALDAADLPLLRAVHAATTDPAAADRDLGLLADLVRAARPGG